jgi:hypothetical protein
MTRSRIERAVARATGEAISTVKRLGFSLVETNVSGCDAPPTCPNVVDWDALDQRRVGLFPNRERVEFAA